MTTAAKSDGWRAFVADTSALVVFFTIVGALNERLVAGMAWDEVATSRAIGAPLMVLTARPYGLWRDVVFRWARPSGRLARLGWDTAALMAFQVPIYAAILAAGGADMAQIGRGVFGFAVLMLICGRPYGFWLDLVRRWFGLGPGGEKPMSLQG